MALTAIHPGAHLAEKLEALDMSAAELARKINVPTNRITQILNGTRAITGDTAPARWRCHAQLDYALRRLSRQTSRQAPVETTCPNRTISTAWGGAMLLNREVWCHRG